MGGLAPEWGFLYMGRKYIFVTGGVVSSVGKGIVTAAIGRLLKSRGLSVVLQKLDPYLNVDPGTMSPYQHGEVFVTADGAETDLDLGHYERFLDQDLTGLSSVTAGQIYQAVIAKERRGDYLGRTIQAIPHVTNEIKERIRSVGERAGAQVVVVEVGGTVGDMEGQPFLEAIRQLRTEEGREDTLSVHVTLLPYLSTTGELKTKPTQHSVRELRSVGIQPDVIICRSDRPVGVDLREKISLFCDVPKRAVVPLLTMPTIYEVPLVLEEAELGSYILQRLGLPDLPRDLSEWQRWVERLKSPQGEVEIAIVGKYVELPDAYLSVKEALIHAGVAHGVGVRLRWVHSQALEEGRYDLLEGIDGIVVPGGFGERGVEGKVAAAHYARERGIPYLGLCLGMQVMVMEYARHVLGWEGAHSTEFDPETPLPRHLTSWRSSWGFTEKGGTMRLGSYPCQLRPGTVAHDQVYGTDLVMGASPPPLRVQQPLSRPAGEGGADLPPAPPPTASWWRFARWQGHPFMVGSQFHPEFRSQARTSPSPCSWG
jgi:CTP synthase